VATIGAGCDGTGQCPPLATKVCAPYACSGSACGGGCVLDSDCASGDYCNAGTCVPKITVGAPCTVSAACTSGFCVDHVCCESLCDRQCEACDIAGAVGVCAPVRSGAPHPPRPACAPIGGCPASCNGDPTTCAPSADCEAPDAGDTGTGSDATSGDSATTSDATGGDAGDGSSDGPSVKPDATPSGDGSTGPTDGSFGDVGQPNENGGCACRAAGGSSGEGGTWALLGVGIAAALVAVRRRRRG
jgi:MYXO-CTERM domain-containing protein